MQGFKCLACAVGVPLKLNDFKVSLGDAAVRAGPARRHVGPLRAGGNAVFRPAGGLVIDKTTHDANISFHEN